MTTRTILATGLTIFAVAPAFSQVAPPPGGMLSTMPRGTYQCALPGDAAGKPFEVVEAEEFAIGAASSYATAEGSGTYILRGKELAFTRGPKKGERFHKLGDNQLQRLDPDGKRGKLICTRLRAAN